MSYRYWLVVMLVLIVSVLSISAQDTVEQALPAQDGMSLLPLNNSLEDYRETLTEEEKAVLNAFFSQNPAIVPTANQTVLASPQALSNVVELDGLFDTFEALAIESLCPLVCAPGDTVAQQFDKVWVEMDRQYTQDQIKYFGYFSIRQSVRAIGTDVTGKITLYFDLNDIFAMTAEGQQDWITLWLSVSVSSSVGVSSSFFGFFDAGVLPFERVINGDDPSMSWRLSGFTVDALWYTCSLIDVINNLDDPREACAVKVDITPIVLRLTLINFEVNLARFEMNTVYLSRSMTQFLNTFTQEFTSPDGTYDAAFILGAYINFIFNYDIFAGALLAFEPQPGEFRAFTCLDDGSQCGDAGAFNVVGGCGDVTGDNLPDNICREAADGTINFSATVIFTALSKIQDDEPRCYRVNTEILDKSLGENILASGWTYEDPYAPIINNCNLFSYGEISEDRDGWRFIRNDPNATDTPTVRLTLRVRNNFNFNESTVVATWEMPVFTVDADADLNDDGIVSPVDAIYVLNRKDTGDFTADLDINGVINDADARIITEALGQ